jgi:hypothetical protein
MMGANMRRRQKKETHENIERYTPSDAARTIAAHTAELAAIAKNSKLVTLEYILAMASLEATALLTPEGQIAA